MKVRVLAGALLFVMAGGLFCEQQWSNIDTKCYGGCFQRVR